MVNFQNNTVSVIDTTTNTVVATVPVGVTPDGVTITPAPQTPKSKDEYRRGGYLKFAPPTGLFNNQGGASATSSTITSSTISIMSSEAVLSN
jgi:YVTN family beta-propeller protein